MSYPEVIAALEDAALLENLRLDEQFLESINNRDVEGAMACFANSPDLTVVLYGTRFKGPQAVRQALTEIFHRFRSVQLKIEEVTRWVLGDTVFAAGIATYEFEHHDGSRSKLSECWTDARRQVRGRWVYVLDHATVIA